jgi:diguanylate cyclase (GGDEF)-like protein/PAS domain S-box-containing protein
MKDTDKTKEQLISELVDLRQRVAELERIANDCRQAEQVLRESKDRLNLTLATAHMGIWEWDIVTNHMIWSEDMEAILNHVPGPFEGTFEAFLNLVHPDDRSVVMRTVKNTLESAQKGNQYGVEFRIIKPNGEIRWTHGRGLVFRDQAGRPLRMMGLGMDITERKQAEEALRAASLLDELTGLYNRRRFLALGEHQLKIANRVKRRLSLLFIDLDGLKWINDNHGHTEGDLALIDTANILRETFRESDIIARIGGDEFAVLVTETAGGGTDILTTRLQENLRAYNAKATCHYNLSVSIGVAQFDPEYPFSIHEMLTQADALMYEEKRGKQKYIQESFVFDRLGKMTEVVQK